MSGKNRGFTLIELMIAVTLGMLAVAAVGSVFIYTSRSFKQDDKISQLQDNLRFAMAQITQDLEMGGFFAQLNNPQTNIVLDTSATSGWGSGCNTALIFENRATYQTRGNATAAEANATFPCVASTEFQPGTDVLLIRRALGACQATPANGRYYLITDGNNSAMYRQGNDPDITLSGFAAPYCQTRADGTRVDIYEYFPTIWYIRNFSVTAGDGIPTLCRKAITGATLETACLATGIEDLQLEFGIDANGDGIADHYTSFNAEASAANIARTVAVRVHLLARSSERDPLYQNEKSYALGNVTHAATKDGFYRRSMSSVVLLRNNASRIAPFALPG